MLCRFIASTSARIVSWGSARPKSGWNSCRLTPRSASGVPFTSSTPSTMDTVRNPTRSDTVSPAVDTVAS